MNMWYFYVLQSTKNPDYFYKGSTDNLQRRLRQHNQSLVTSTKPFGPFRLVYYEAYLSEHGARIREASVKKSGSVSVPLLRRIRDSLS
ncbi:MAG TPA: excinuclease ABC subunit C [Candidatus Peribacter riflensis]|nr:excinuclease ABC subunit C [Candidatus Peribacter riflensis]HBU09656.1 excinuclease ABC subunit C [Candidatus Peribacter riflensis]